MNACALSLTPHRRRPVRTSTGLLVAGVLLAGLATPLRADVIDDFSGPKKFVVLSSVGLPEYELNGQLHWSYPPAGAASLWHLSSSYELPEGQPVEFRVDVVGLAHADAATGLGIAFPTPPTNPRGASYLYIVYWLPERVFLHKAYGTAVSDGVFDVSHESSFEPVTLSLTLTRQGSSLKLGTEVVRLGEPEQVLFAREVTDGPAIDFAGDNGVPPEGPVMGVGVYFGSATPSTGADGVFDNLVCSADPKPMALGIQHHAGTPVMLEWSNIGVLLEADGPAGPWKPWPGVVSEDGGASQAAIPASGQAGFYRLAAGEHVLDLFNTQWATIPRKIASPWPGQSSVPALSLSGGRGRIRGTGVRNEDFLLYYEFGLPASGDVLASVDIVDWDETMEDAAFGIVLRANPGTELWFPATDGLPQDQYAGLLTFKKAGIPSESVLSLTGPGGEGLTSQSFPAVDPAKQYRLRFGAVGDRLTLELFSLDELGNETLVKSCEATDGRVVEGMDALYGTKASGETYDVTVDRYLVSRVFR